MEEGSKPASLDDAVAADAAAALQAAWSATVISRFPSYSHLMFCVKVRPPVAQVDGGGTTVQHSMAVHVDPEQVMLAGLVDILLATPEQS